MNKKRSTMLNKILSIDVLLASIPLFILIGITFMAVIMRYVVGKPLGWVEEIQLICIVWIIFAGGGAAFRSANHVSIEVLYDIFPIKMRRALDIMILIVSLLVVGYLFIRSLDYLKVFVNTGRTTSILHIPYTFIYSIVPISCALQAVNIVLTTVFGVTEEEEAQNE